MSPPLERKPPISSLGPCQANAPTSKSPAIRNCSDVFENQYTISHAGDAAMWSTFSLRESVIIFRAFSPPRSATGRKPLNTTVRQRGLPSLSTVPIWTKFPPLTLRDLAMEYSMRSTHGTTPGGAPTVVSSAAAPMSLRPWPSDTWVAIRCRGGFDCRRRRSGNVSECEVVASFATTATLATRALVVAMFATHEAREVHDHVTTHHSPNVTYYSLPQQVLTREMREREGRGQESLLRQPGMKCCS